MRETDSFKVKPKNPRLNKNWLSVLTFWYTLKIFRLGMKRSIEEQDLSEPLAVHKADSLGHNIAIKWTAEINKAIENKRKPKLINALRKCFFTKLIILGVILAISEISRLIMPLCVGLTIRYFSATTVANSTSNSTIFFHRVFYYWSPNQEPITKSEAYLYIIGIILFSLLPVLIYHPYIFECAHIGMRMRIACCSLIYRKVPTELLVLSPIYMFRLNVLLDQLRLINNDG